MELKTLPLRIKEYFEMTTPQCRKEYQELTQTDKQFFVDGFNAMGIGTKPLVTKA